MYRGEAGTATAFLGDRYVNLGGLSCFNTVRGSQVLRRCMWAQSHKWGSQEVQAQVGQLGSTSARTCARASETSCFERASTGRESTAVITSPTCTLPPSTPALHA